MKYLTTALILFIFATPLLADDEDVYYVETENGHVLACNWGELTSEEVNDGTGREHGEHSSDPSGDGRGPENRVGLANVIARGNMQATCQFIRDALDAEEE